MARSIQALSDAPNAHEQLIQLQVEQHAHDEKYHREIARLSMHQRLNHMALHFSKYTGKIALAGGEPPAIAAVSVDVLIICMSTANVVNVDLYSLIVKDERNFPTLRTLGSALANDLGEEVKSQAGFIRAMAMASGKMAAACEKIDHLEEISFRSEIKDAIGRLASLALAFIVGEGSDPETASRQRLATVKNRLVLHGWI